MIVQAGFILSYAEAIYTWMGWSSCVSKTTFNINIKKKKEIVMVFQTSDVVIFSALLTCSMPYTT